MVDLIDPYGNKLIKSQEDVLEELKEIAPANKEEEEIFIREFGKALKRIHQKEAIKGIKNDFNNTFKENAQDRMMSDGFTEDRSWRRIARIPKPMLRRAKDIWGEDVLENDAKFKEAFIEDEDGQLCLTVDRKTI